MSNGLPEQAAAASPAITPPAPDCSACERYFSSSTKTRSCGEADAMLATPLTSTLPSPCSRAPTPSAISSSLRFTLSQSGNRTEVRGWRLVEKPFRQIIEKRIIEKEIIGKEIIEKEIIKRDIIDKTKIRILMPSRITRSHRILIQILAFGVLALPLHSPAQQLARRLVLKDGSYQSITKYEVKGDRVRYYSAEREEWEELPSSLVDWPATEKYEKDRASAPAIPEAALIDKETDADREAEGANLPQVAPGLHLPELSGMFLLDNFKGQPQLVELQQGEGDINRNTKGNILRGVVASGKATIELDGEHAPTYAHVAVPDRKSTRLN